jgi:ectoine hydroxylase-related dioxygenase (phytanoyl-CoA dioxygenase family)
MVALAKTNPTARAVSSGETYAAIRKDFRAEFSKTVADLGLAPNIAELDMHGYTIVRGAAPVEFFRELRVRIVEVTNERRERGKAADPRGLFSQSVQDVVGKGCVFEDAVTNPKIIALTTYLLGDGFVLNAANTTIVEQGCPALFIHSDNAYIPDPFPQAAQIATAVWVLDEFTAEKGASRVVKGSHNLNRHPLPGEGEDVAEAIECEPGSIIMWNGATWHGNCGRAAPGDRVALHTSFCRMHLRSFVNNATIPFEVANRSPLMAQLLGYGLPMGTEGDEGPDPVKRAHAARLSVRKL